MFKKIIIGSIVLTLVLLTVCVVSDDKPKGNPFKIIIILPKSHKENEIITELGEKHYVDFWSYPSQPLGVVTALVNEVTNKDFIEGLKQKKIVYKLEETDSLLTRIQKQLSRKTTSRVGEKFDYDNSYHTLEQIYDELDRLAKDYSKNVEVFSLKGLSYEKRFIKVIKLFGNEIKERIVFLECGIHAREWLSPAFCMWTINLLVNNHRLLNDYDFVIIPVLNPDGYRYTWSDWKSTEDMKTWTYSEERYDDAFHTRFWRKNRQDNLIEFYPPPELREKYRNITNSHHSLHLCTGIDLNRNWDTKEFCVHGSGHNTYPCQVSYCGTKPMRAPEIIALSEYLTSIGTKIVAYFNFHSYSQVWMYPLSYTKEKAPNNDYLEMLSKKAVEAIAKVHGTKFKYGQPGNIMYLASGTSDDWVYDTLKVKLVFCIEMRPTPDKYREITIEQIHSHNISESRFGFAPDESEIKPACEEVFAGVEAVLDQITYNYIQGGAAVEAGSGGLSTQMMASIITITVILISASILLFV